MIFKYYGDVMNGNGGLDKVTKETQTYRNSCLVVLVGEVGKSSSLPEREAEKNNKKMTDREKRREESREQEGRRGESYPQRKHFKTVTYAVINLYS